MVSFRYFCASSDNRLPWLDGMGWASDWAGAGTETGAGAGLVWPGTCAGGIKLGWEKSRANKQNDVLDLGEVGWRGEACQLYRQTVGLTEFQFFSLLLLLLSCFYCHRIIEAVSKEKKAADAAATKVTHIAEVDTCCVLHFQQSRGWSGGSCAANWFAFF